MDKNTETILFRLEHPEYNHFGGTVAIRGGFLYVGLGDGGGSGDPDDHSQNDASYFGKMLRFDLAQQGPPPWTPEIWAKGFRNPYRFSFDSQTGDLYVGDVGQASIEEVDVEPADSPGGLNYGWDVMEGTSCFTDPDGGPDPGEPPCHDPSLVLPAYEYANDDVTCLVTGGAVYRGNASPSLRGLYFFTDGCAARITTFRWNPSTGLAEDVTDRHDEFLPDVGNMFQLVAIAPDGFGELYAVSLLAGSVYKLGAGAGRVAARRDGARDVRVRRATAARRVAGDRGERAGTEPGRRGLGRDLHGARRADGREAREAALIRRGAIGAVRFRRRARRRPDRERRAAVVLQRAQLRVRHEHRRRTQGARHVRAAARARDRPLQVAAAFGERGQTRDRVPAVAGLVAVDDRVVERDRAAAGRRAGEGEGTGRRVARDRRMADHAGDAAVDRDAAGQARERRVLRDRDVGRVEGGSVRAEVEAAGGARLVPRDRRVAHLDLYALQIQAARHARR